MSLIKQITKIISMPNMIKTIKLKIKSQNH